MNIFLMSFYITCAKYLLTSLKHLLILKNVPKATSEFLFWPPLLPLVDPVYISKQAFGNILRVTGGFGNNIDISIATSYLKAETGVLKKATRRIFRISKRFYRSKRNFSAKRRPNIVKTISAYIKVLF